MLGEYINTTLMIIILIAIFLILKSPKKRDDKSDNSFDSKDNQGEVK